MSEFVPAKWRIFRAGWGLAALGVLWALAVGLGLRTMLNYEDGPSESASAPAVWPQASSIPQIPGLPTIVVFAHPRCPCSNATIGELSILMTRLQGKVAAVVLFIRPKNLPEGWEVTDLWRHSEEIPGVRVLADPGGVEAARFGAEASGQTMLYDVNQRLRFSGGITASRGHSGDNAGRSAIVSLVTTGTAQVTQTSVYGCSLHDPVTLTDKGETTWLASPWTKRP